MLYQAILAFESMADVSTSFKKISSEPNSTGSSVGYKVDLTLESLHKIVNCEYEIKAVDLHFPVVLDQTLSDRKDNCTIQCSGLLTRLFLNCEQYGFYTKHNSLVLTVNIKYNILPLI